MRIKLTNQVSGTNFRLKRDKKTLHFKQLPKKFVKEKRKQERGRKRKLHTKKEKKILL